MKQILFIMAIVCGIFAQYDVLAQQKKFRSPQQMYFPLRDTVIIKGSKIKIGSHLRKGWLDKIEIENFRSSKKSDLEKGIFFIEVSPQKTTSYMMTMYMYPNRDKQTVRRTIYVVESEEEKKVVEEKMIKEKANPLGIKIMSPSMRVMDDDTKKDTTKNKTNTSSK